MDGDKDLVRAKLFSFWLFQGASGAMIGRAVAHRARLPRP